MEEATPTEGRLPFTRRPLRAQLDYEQDGTVLFRMDGHEAARFERVMEAVRAAIPVAAREWRPALGLWVIDAGWDEELLDLLEDHFERADILVRGCPLEIPEEAEEREETTWLLAARRSGHHGWIDLEDRWPLRPRLGRLILPYWEDGSA
jgi:hypothetical protein